MFFVYGLQENRYFLCGVLGIPKCEPHETEDHAILKWRAYTMGSWAFDEQLNRGLVKEKLKSLCIYRKDYVFTSMCKCWLRLIRQMDGVDLSFEQANDVDYYFEMLTLAPLPPELTGEKPQVVNAIHKETLHGILLNVGSILEDKFNIGRLDFTLDADELSDTVETINSLILIVADGAAVELIKHFVLLLELVVTISDVDACEYIDLTSKITSCYRDLYKYTSAKVSTGQSLMWHAINRIAAVIERKLCN